MSRKTKKVDRLPRTRSSVALVIHAAYWVLYVLLLVSVFSVLQMQLAGKPPLVSSLAPILLLFTVPGVFSFYAHYGIIFPHFLARRRMYGLLGSSVLVCFVSAVLGGLLSLPLFGLDQAILSDGRELLAMIGAFMVLAAIHGATGLVIGGFITWFDEIRVKEQLERKNLQMELDLIRSQINPHFLFNTLNNIDVLITSDPSRASLYLNKLSEILRYTVYETSAEKIPLELELEHLQRYLELQKIRSANPNFVQFDVSGPTGGFEIAPMILFPFIENAFKHADKKRETGSIRIRATTAGSRLVFECENYFKAGAGVENEIGGAGNRLIARRLELLYPERHQLDIEIKEQEYRVRLDLELDRQST